MNSRWVYFNLALSLYHFPSVHSPRSSISRAISEPPPPLPPPCGTSCLTQKWRGIFPKAFSYCLYLLNTISGSRPLTTTHVFLSGLNSAVEGKTTIPFVNIFMPVFISHLALTAICITLQTDMKYTCTSRVKAALNINIWLPTTSSSFCLRGFPSPPLAPDEMSQKRHSGVVLSHTPGVFWKAFQIVDDSKNNDWGDTKNWETASVLFVSYSDKGGRWKTSVDGPREIVTWFRKKSDIARCSTVVTQSVLCFSITQ